MSEQTTIQGLVCVYLEPGPDISEGDLNGWYYNKHAPLRLTAPGFATAARYKAADSQAPTWLTLYDVTTPEIVASTEGVALGALGSENDNLSISRRTYALLGTVVDPKTTAEDLPGKCVLVVNFEIAPENEDDFNRWCEHMDLVARIPGWKRRRRYKLVKCEQIRGQFMADQPASKYLAIHELNNGDFEHSAEIKHARSTEWAQRIIKSAIRREVRTFELHEVLG
ncbi:hypothetical protein B0H19DRAFT_924697 [Mycena capillaripes]|nr:hypothetical protein B0H19DRAFT_924697 [Mycena capillaripes]